VDLMSQSEVDCGATHQNLLQHTQHSATKSLRGAGDVLFKHDHLMLETVRLMLFQVAFLTGNSSLKTLLVGL